MQPQCRDCTDPRQDILVAPSPASPVQTVSQDHPELSWAWCCWWYIVAPSSTINIGPLPGDTSVERCRVLALLLTFTVRYQILSLPSTCYARSQLELITNIVLKLTGPDTANLISQSMIALHKTRHGSCTCLQSYVYPDKWKDEELQHL